VERGRWDDVGELMRKLVGESRQQRSAIILALYAGERPMCRPIIGIAATISVSNCRNETCPLAQSVERVHGKENSRAISSHR
jgi:hypothetical protein